MTGRRVGFIGLGEMGKPMAANALRRGFDVTVLGHVRPQPVEELRRLGAKVARSGKELAQASEFIVSVVVDRHQTEEVVFGNEGLWEGMEAGTTLIVASTLEPQFVRGLCSKMNERDVAVLDAPITGGVRGAQEGTLTIIVGGEEKVFEKCRPLLEAMGKNIFYMGGIGNGMVTKLVNNTIMAVTLFGAIEGLTLGVKAGVNLERLIEVINTGTGRSQVTENLVRKYGQRIKTGHTMMGKDLGIALELSREVGVRLPVVALVSNLDVAAEWRGLGLGSD